MGVNLSIKDVPDAWAERLRQRAARNHRSLQGELMALVESAASEDPAGSPAPSQRRGAPGSSALVQIAQAARQRFPSGTPSSVEWIRQLRNTRHGEAGEG